MLLCLICQTSIFCYFLRKWANAQNVNLFTCCHIINSVDYTSFISDLLQFDINQSDPPEPKFLALLCVTTNGIILVCCPHNQDDVETGCSVIKKFRHNRFHSCRGVRSIIIYHYPPQWLLWAETHGTDQSISSQIENESYQKKMRRAFTSSAFTGTCAVGSQFIENNVLPETKPHLLHSWSWDGYWR